MISELENNKQNIPQHIFIINNGVIKKGGLDELGF